MSIDLKSYIAGYHKSNFLFDNRAACTVYTMFRHPYLDFQPTTFVENQLFQLALKFNFNNCSLMLYDINIPYDTIITKTNITMGIIKHIPKGYYNIILILET